MRDPRPKRARRTYPDDPTAILNAAGDANHRNGRCAALPHRGRRSSNPLAAEGVQYDLRYGLARTLDQENGESRSLIVIPAQAEPIPGVQNEPVAEPPAQWCVR